MPVRSHRPGKEGPTTSDPGSFRGEFVAPAARAFVDWAATTAGSLGILDWRRFQPSDVKAWFGDISILQRNVQASDYRYRLFGTNWPIVLGQNLTGQPLSVWPRAVARAIRDRVHTVTARRVPVGARLAVTSYLATSATRFGADTRCSSR